MYCHPKQRIDIRDRAESMSARVYRRQAQPSQYIDKGCKEADVLLRLLLAAV